MNVDGDEDHNILLVGRNFLADDCILSSVSLFHPLSPCCFSFSIIFIYDSNVFGAGEGVCCTFISITTRKIFQIKTDFYDNINTFSLHKTKKKG